MAPADSITACPTWDVSYAECDTLGPESCWSPTSKAIYEQVAVEYLWNWTGKGYGLCPVTVRPCRSECSLGMPHPLDPVGPWMWGPVLLAGQWYNLACGICGDLCSCVGTPTALRLPGPIDSITQILIDGQALAQSAYRVDSGWVLVRQDGDGWPSCQDMSLPAGEVGTWSIEYVKGTPVPLGGQVAAGVLAIELAKFACRDSTCQLPRRVQSVTRQGVTVAILDSFDDVDKGRTGVWLVDSWVASVTKRPKGGTVASVDVPRPRHRVTTWTAPVNPV